MRFRDKVRKPKRPVVVYEILPPREKDGTLDSYAEKITNEDLIKEKYRGIRPAFGYPACPNHEAKEKLFEILDATKIDMKLTENYSMMPAASVSGLYFANKKSKYFSVL